MEVLHCVASLTIKQWDFHLHVHVHVHTCIYTLVTCIKMYNTWLL